MTMRSGLARVRDVPMGYVGLGQTPWSGSALLRQEEDG
jgi:hypothetical protein